LLTVLLLVVVLLLLPVLWPNVLSLFASCNESFRYVNGFNLKEADVKMCLILNGEILLFNFYKASELQILL
jgi:hypothetical protein